MLIFEKLNRQNNMKCGAPHFVWVPERFGGRGAAQHAAHMQHEVQDALEFLPSQERSWRKPRDQISMLKWMSKRNGNTKPSY